MSYERNCPICQSTAHRKASGYPGYRDPDCYDIYDCPNCRVAFADPLRVDPAIYERIYEGGNAVPGYDRYYRYAEEVKVEDDPLAYLAATEDVYHGVDRALSQLPPKSRVLDVGCGIGYLTYALLRRGHDATGLELSSRAVSRAIAAYGGQYECGDVRRFDAEPFAAIVATELVEHVADPVDLVRSMDRLLAPGGRIVITTPNRTRYPGHVTWDT